MKEGQIPSRTLMSLNMIFQVAINQHYGHHVTNNVWTTIKHLSPHLGIIVVSGLRVVYTIIIVRISYDIFITLCSILTVGQSRINITPNIYTYV